MYLARQIMQSLILKPVLWRSTLPQNICAWRGPVRFLVGVLNKHRARRWTGQGITKLLFFILALVCILYTFRAKTTASRFSRVSPIRWGISSGLDIDGISTPRISASAGRPSWSFSSWLIFRFSPFLATVRTTGLTGSIHLEARPWVRSTAPCLGLSMVTTTYTWFRLNLYFRYHCI